MLTKYKRLHRRAPAEIYRDSKDTFAIKETDSVNTCYKDNAKSVLKTVLSLSLGFPYAAPTIESSLAQSSARRGSWSPRRAGCAAVGCCEKLGRGRSSLYSAGSGSTTASSFMASDTQSNWSSEMFLPWCGGKRKQSHSQLTNKSSLCYIKTKWNQMLYIKTKWDAIKTRLALFYFLQHHAFLQVICILRPASVPAVTLLVEHIGKSST